MKRPTILTRPHAYQRVQAGPSRRLDPCGYPGCKVLAAHAIHQQPDDEVRDITEPARRPEEDQ